MSLAIGFARPELLATTEWLGDQVGRAEVRIIDVRWRPDGSGAAAFQAGHIPGATYLDWREQLNQQANDEDGPGLRLAPADRVATAMSRAGVGDTTTLVIYDDSDALYAARTWWSLRVYGYESARILDGGFHAWQLDGRQVGTGSIPHPETTFTARLNPRLRLTTTDIRAILGSTEVQLLDARAAPEYRGFEGNARRLGHIPGAMNVPVGAMHRPGSQRLRDPETIRGLLLGANVARGKRLVCYDGSGVGAAKLAFILSLMGYEDVAVYDGGWAEWGDRLDLPVER